MGNRNSKITNIEKLIKDSRGQQPIKLKYKITGHDAQYKLNIISEYTGVMTDFSVVDAGYRKVELTLENKVWPLTRTLTGWCLPTTIKIPIFLFSDDALKLYIYPTHDMGEVQIIYTLWDVTCDSERITDGTYIYNADGTII